MQVSVGSFREEQELGFEDGGQPASERGSGQHRSDYVGVAESLQQGEFPLIGSHLAGRVDLGHEPLLGDLDAVETA